MSVPKVVAVVGFKDAGKTRVVEALVAELNHRELRVGTLKHASREHYLDTPGKDTMRHRKAGSVASAILTSESAAVFFNQALNVEEAISKLGSIDIVIIEGFKSLDTVARIVVPRGEEDLKSLSNGLEIAVSGPSVEKPFNIGKVPTIPLSKIEDLADIVEAKAFPILPGLNCGGCGYDFCRYLAKTILKGEASLEKCINRSASNFNP